MSEAVATVQVWVDMTVDILRCGCGKPRSHAPYDGSRRGRIRAVVMRLLGRSIVNRPCPTPHVEQETKSELREFTQEELARITGGNFGNRSNERR